MTIALAIFLGMEIGFFIGMWFGASGGGPPPAQRHSHTPPRRNPPPRAT